MKTHRDVIVVGAGMAGLLTAYILKQEGKDVLVLEAKEIASGQTGRTTAKITSQHGLKYSELLKKVGERKTRLYARANETAINAYEGLIYAKNIDCEFKRVTSYLYSRKDIASLQEECSAANLLGIDAFFTTETELPFEVAGAVGFRNQAQFCAVDFIHHIAAELEILEHTMVEKVRGKKVFTKDKVYTAEHIVIATHYPMKNVPGFYFLREHQERSFVLELSGCESMNGMYYGIDEESYSFRQAGKNILFGGGSGRTGEHLCGMVFETLEQAAREYYPDCKVESRWAAQDCMPHDGIPFIGKYSVFTPRTYVATGFQKWGMTTSMVAALILRDKICGKENAFSALFCPQRVNIRAGMADFLRDVGVSFKGLSKGWFGPKDLRCSHMGCGLEWNPAEKSWDCPCHGSRFDEDGNLLDNPAKKGI